jgi:hypothetical protein
LIWLGGVEWKLAPASNPVHPVVRHHDIHRQPMKPGRQRTFPAEKVELLPGANERLLGELLGEICIAGEAPAQSVDPPDLLSVDLLEGFPVAILSALHEPFRLFFRGRDGLHGTRYQGKGIRHSTLDAWGCILV